MRRYLPTFADLVDRLSIVILKSVFIPENKKEYEAEQELILYDLDDIIDERLLRVNGQMIRTMLILMLTNRFIWENESKARLGGPEQDGLLKLTHSINGVRNTAKNVLSESLGERKDLKIDSFASEFVRNFGNWNLFPEPTKVEWTGPKKI